MKLRRSSTPRCGPRLLPPRTTSRDSRRCSCAGSRRAADRARRRCRALRPVRGRTRRSGAGRGRGARGSGCRGRDRRSPGRRRLVSVPISRASASVMAEDGSQARCGRRGCRVPVTGAAGRRCTACAGPRQPSLHGLRSRPALGRGRHPRADGSRVPLPGLRARSPEQRTPREVAERCSGIPTKGRTD